MVDIQAVGGGTEFVNVGTSPNANCLVALVSLTIEWAEARNLLRGSTPKDQFHKLIQECGELSDSLCKNKDARDDIGDVLVVLIIIATQLGLSLRECLEKAYNDIKDRKGKMVDGVFIKEQDL